ncbi:MAG: hypothetical protein J5892_04730 [Bacilli bacterium]|nr:hypothetical protein [Bacilli bacterium]
MVLKAMYLDLQKKLATINIVNNNNPNNINNGVYTKQLHRKQAEIRTNANKARMQKFINTKNK